MINNGTEYIHSKDFMMYNLELTFKISKHGT